MFPIPGLKMYAIVGVAALLAGLAGGAAIGTWRAEAACGDKTLTLATRINELGSQVTKLTGEKAELELAIEKANGALQVAEAQTKASDAARAQAQQYAADLAGFSKSRMDKLAKAVASSSSCSDVLNSYWEIRK